MAQKIKLKKKKSNKLIYILAGGAVVLIAGLFFAKSQGWIGGTKSDKVTAAKAKRVEIVEKVSASGRVQPELEVNISPEVSGEIRELLIEEGDSVVQGQLLLKIRPDNYVSALDRAQAGRNTQRANLAQSKAALQQSKARFLQAKRDYDRQKQLQEQKIISLSDLEQSKTAFSVAQSDYESAKQRVEGSRFSVLSADASVKEANENLNLTSIFAAMSGTVSRLSVEKGERVVGTSQMAGTELLRIADLNNMEVVVDVNENDIIRISVGDTAIIEVDAYAHSEQKFKGIVKAIANSANQVSAGSDAVTEFQVEIRILNDSYSKLQAENGGVSPFRPGMTASVEIITDRKTNILTVPLASVTARKPGDIKKRSSRKKDGDKEEGDDKSEGKTTDSDELQELVFVIEDGKAVAKMVKTGISDFDNIEIIEGLSEGDEIITGPFLLVSKKLREGDAVDAGKKSDEKEKE